MKQWEKMDTIVPTSGSLEVVSPTLHTFPTGNNVIASLPSIVDRFIISYIHALLCTVDPVADTLSSFL